MLLLSSSLVMAEQQAFFDPMEPYPVRQQKQSALQQQKALEANHALNAPPNFNLTFVLSSHNRKMAIINEKPVFVGDTINGYTVIHIKDDYVTFKKNNKTWTVDMIQPIIRN